MRQGGSTAASSSRSSIATDTSHDFAGVKPTAFSQRCRLATFADRVPAHAYFVGSAIFHYLGASFAVLLFARVPVAGVAWLRIISAAAVFTLWRNRWRWFLVADGDARRAVVALGVVFALMNYSFYVAIDRLPLGTIAAIVFVGPIVLALAGCRSGRNVDASSMCAWQFMKALAISDRNGWARFVAIRNHYNLVYREEEREMLPSMSLGRCRGGAVEIVQFFIGRVQHRT